MNADPAETKQGLPEAERGPSAPAFWLCQGCPVCGNAAHLLILLLAISAAYLYQVQTRQWFADDYVHLQRLETEGFTNFVTSWWAHENGRLDALLQAAQLQLPAIGVHLFAVSLHALNSLLLYILVARLTNQRAGLIAALVFGLHPQSSEAVLWAATANYRVGAGACLIAAICATREGPGAWKVWCIGAATLLLGLWTMEQAILFAPILGLLALRARELLLPKHWGAAALYAASGVGAFFLMKLVGGAGKDTAISLNNLGGKLAVQLLQATRRALSPGLRSGVLPMLTGEEPVDAWTLLTWIAVPLTVAILAWRWNEKRIGCGPVTEGKEQEQRGPIRWELLLMGFMIFALGYAIGALAKHPYMAKRMFYLPGIGLAISAGVALDALLRILPGRILPRSALALAALGIGAIGTPVILLQAREYADHSQTVQQVRATLATTSRETPVILIGVKPDEFRYAVPEARFLDTVDLNQRATILDLRGGTATERTPTVTGLGESLPTDTTAAHIQTAAWASPSIDPTGSIATLGADLRLLRVEVRVAVGAEAHVLLEFSCPDTERLHQVYPKITLLHANGRETPFSEERNPAVALGNQRWRITRGSLIMHASPVRAVRLGFTALAADPALATITATGDGSWRREKDKLVFGNPMPGEK